MQVTLSNPITQFAHLLQEELFPHLEPAIGPISDRHALFIATCAMVPFARYLPCGRWNGRPSKDRLAIARAVLGDPAVLLLDEATSALDAESEEAVQRGLDQAMAGRTVLVIAHRLSTVQEADVIVVLENGRIVDQGNHDLLISRPGRYRDLCERQLIRGA